MIIEEIEEGVHIFDKSKPVCLATDWSKTGVGFCSSKNTAIAPLLNPSAATQVGKLPLLGAASHMLLDRALPWWKGRPLLLLMPSIKRDSLYWAAGT